jgi:uncharacterized spore protein YtfJ
MDFRDYVKELIGEISEHVNSDTVFGASREIGSRVVIPVAQVGYGGGGGFGRGDEKDGDSGSGGGGGLNIKAKPLGVIVVSEEEVAWLPTPDVTRVVVVGCLVALAALVTVRSMASA